MVHPIGSVADAAIVVVLLNGTLVVAPRPPSLIAMPLGPGDWGALAAELPGNALANAVADRPLDCVVVIIVTERIALGKRHTRAAIEHPVGNLDVAVALRAPPSLDPAAAEPHSDLIDAAVPTNPTAPSPAFSAVLILWRESHTRRERRFIREAACTATAKPPASYFPPCRAALLRCTQVVQLDVLVGRLEEILARALAPKGLQSLPAILTYAPPGSFVGPHTRPGRKKVAVNACGVVEWT